jgi:hypothetical protein
MGCVLLWDSIREAESTAKIRHFSVLRQNTARPSLATSLPSWRGCAIRWIGF